MNGIGMIIEAMVAVLLIATIAYCMMLNRRLKLLKADEHLLRATISELVTATDIAERAIGGLKATVRECDLGLGERLRSAERVTADFDHKFAASKDVLDRLTKIVSAVRGHDETGGSKNDPQAVAAAAQAFAEKVRTKVYGLAA